VVRDSSRAVLKPGKSSHCGSRELLPSGGAVDFERLYQMHAQRVYRLCCRMVRDNAEAEDLTQEVFIQLFRKIHTFRGEAAFTTWLHRLAVNVVLMRLRKKSRIEPPLGKGAQSGEEPDDAREELGAPDTALTGAIDRLDLERAVAQLPAGFKRAFVLHDVEEYGHGEIARMLGVAVGTSKSQLHKARLRLRDLLRGDGGLRPRGEAGGESGNVAPKPLMGRGVSGCRAFVLAPQGASLRPTILNGLRDVHRRASAAHGTAPETTNSTLWR